MAAFDESFDYLGMLNVDPANLTLDIAALRDLLKQKRKEWTGQAINPLYQQQARANLERAKQFEQILRDPAALEAYVSFLLETRAADRHQHEHEVSQWLHLALGGTKSELTLEQRDLLRKACDDRGIPPAIVDDLIRVWNLAIREDGPTATGPRLPYKQPAMERTLLAQFHNYVRVLGKKSLYELLDVPVQTSPARLVSIAQLAYNRWSKSLPKTNTCIAWEKSLQACMTYLKDAEGKARYDRALYNERLDEFLRRVDLVLAGGKLSRDAHLRLAQIGVEEFGLTSAIVNQCIQYRAASRGLPLAKPVLVTVQVQGQVQCTRCYRWNAPQHPQCAGCGSSLVQKCRNPACGKTLAADAKVCGQCALSVPRGRQYAELLRLIDTLLATGGGKAAQDACRLAQQILPSTDVASRASRAAEIRVLTAAVRRAVAEKQWTRAQFDLSRLLLLSPQFSHPGIPQLEDIDKFLSEMRQAVAQLPADASAESVGEFCLKHLAQWTDFAEALHIFFRQIDKLESTGKFAAALDLLTRLSDLQPRSDELETRRKRLQIQVDQEHERERVIADALRAWQRSLHEKRLYAAERAYDRLLELDSEDSVADAAESLHRQLADVRAEIHDIRQHIAQGAPPDATIARYLAVLQQCRDCKEALTGLQQTTPTPPAAPDSLDVVLAGTRRLLTWTGPAESTPDLNFIIERTTARPAGRPGDSAPVILYDGPARHYCDDEVVHTGTLLRYTVRAVRRGRLEVEGHVLRDYTVSSPPRLAEPLLMWQEVLNLRIERAPQALILRWHQPAGTRQVVIERWTGGREDRPPQPVLLSATQEGRLHDIGLQDGQTYTYRLYGVYDGPAGDFLTPGVMVSDMPRADAAPAAAPVTAAPVTAAPASAASASARSRSLDQDPLPFAMALTVGNAPARDDAPLPAPANIATDSPAATINGASQHVLQNAEPSIPTDEPRRDIATVATPDTAHAAASNSAGQSNQELSAAADPLTTILEAAPVHKPGGEESSPMKRFGVWPPPAPKPAPPRDK